MTSHAPVASRPYAGERDLHRMLALVGSSSATEPRYTFWHVGNLLWSMYYNPSIDPARCARLWEGEDGELLGFAWLDGGELAMHVHPRLRGEGFLEEAMLGWAEGEVARAAGDEPPRLSTYACEDDAPYAALLERRGYAPDREDASLLMERDLHEPIPDLAPPGGAVVRSVGDGERELEERVAAHRDAWEPSVFSIEAYRRLRAAPGYAPEWDLVAVLPDGAFAAYALCWYDAANRSGLFEPVGARTAYRRRGFARAVMLDALRRLRDRGAEKAMLSTGEHEEPARRLYEAVGFRAVNREFEYSKTL